METVNIFIDKTLKDEKYYSCPIEWRVEEIEEHIRRFHELIGGEIKCDNYSLKYTDRIRDYKDVDILRFVNGKMYL